jgi:hypothetical protein
MIRGYHLLLLLVCWVSLGPLPVRAQDRRTHWDQRLVQSLRARPLHWPHELARLFVDSIPPRIALPLSGQSTKTIEHFARRAAIPRTSLSQPVHFACWASWGIGGGYMMIVRRTSGDYSCVWDSLMPPSFISPQFEFRDVDGDSVVEIICYGRKLDQPVSEWAIVHWNDSTAFLMAPRLDQPSESITDNRLIGQDLQFEYPPEQTAARLLLTLGRDIASPPSNDADSAAAVRVFEYVDSIAGFLPSPSP